MGDQLDLLDFSWADARGAGHRVPDLDSWPRPPAWATHGLPVAWWQFHVEHPDVEVALVRLARALLARGYTHIGIAMLWETARYETMLGAAPDEDTWRLNNNHRAYYARWLMEQHPDLAGVFELRESQAERETACSDDS